MDNFRFTKSKFLLKIIEVEKVKINDKEQLNVVGSKSEWCRGSDLERSLREDYKNSVSRKIEFCNGKPDTFAVGVLYIRKDGKEAYVFKEREN